MIIYKGAPFTRGYMLATLKEGKDGSAHDSMATVFFHLCVKPILDDPKAKWSAVFDQTSKDSIATKFVSVTARFFDSRVLQKRASKAHIEPGQLRSLAGCTEDEAYFINYVLASGGLADWLPDYQVLRDVGEPGPVTAEQLAAICVAVKFYDSVFSATATSFYEEIARTVRLGRPAGYNAYWIGDDVVRAVQSAFEAFCANISLQIDQLKGLTTYDVSTYVDAIERLVAWYDCRPAGNRKVDSDYINNKESIEPILKIANFRAINSSKTPSEIKALAMKEALTGTLKDLRDALNIITSRLDAIGCSAVKGSDYMRLAMPSTINPGSGAIITPVFGLAKRPPIYALSFVARKFGYQVFTNELVTAKLASVTQEELKALTELANIVSQTAIKASFGEVHSSLSSVVVDSITTLPLEVKLDLLLEKNLRYVSYEGDEKFYATPRPQIDEWLMMLRAVFCEIVEREGMATNNDIDSIVFARLLADPPSSPLYPTATCTALGALGKTYEDKNSSEETLRSPLFTGEDFDSKRSLKSDDGKPIRTMHTKTLLMTYCRPKAADSKGQPKLKTFEDKTAWHSLGLVGGTRHTVIRDEFVTHEIARLNSFLTGVFADAALLTAYEDTVFRFAEKLVGRARSLFADHVTSKLSADGVKFSNDGKNFDFEREANRAISLGCLSLYINYAGMGSPEIRDLLLATLKVAKNLSISKKLNYLDVGEIPAAWR